MLHAGWTLYLHIINQQTGAALEGQDASWADENATVAGGADQLLADSRPQVGLQSKWPQDKHPARRHIQTSGGFTEVPEWRLSDTCALSPLVHSHTFNFFFIHVSKAVQIRMWLSSKLFFYPAWLSPRHPWLLLETEEVKQWLLHSCTELDDIITVADLVSVVSLVLFAKCHQIGHWWNDW